MDLGIAGRTALVCASSRGLGRGCAEALAEAGCRVIVNGRDREALERTAAEIRAASGAEVIAVAADVSTREGQRALLQAAGEVEILVNNNAGPPRRPFRELDRDAMVAGVLQNMVTPIELAQSVLDGMVERRFGRIVNITSLAVLMPITGLELSSGARAGLTSFLAGVAREVARHNVTINNLLPGKIATDRLTATMRWGAERAGIGLEAEIERQTGEIPARRLGTPEEFGKICAFLCSAHAGYVTGRNIPVDGGLNPAAF